jgi:hypothetical protein
MALATLVPLPDETARGLLGRIEWINGRRLQCLRELKWHNPKTVVVPLARMIGMGICKFARLHTMEPFRYAHFADEESWIEMKAESWVPNLPVAEYDPARFCPACIQEDLSAFGFSYWHRCHQLPSVVFCQRHEVPLMQVRGGTAMKRLPHASLGMATPCMASVANADQRQTLLRYGMFAAATLWRKRPVVAELMRSLLRRQADQMNVVADPRGRRPGLLKLALEKCPRSWLAGFPNVLKNPRPVNALKYGCEVSRSSRVAINNLTLALLFEHECPALNRLLHLSATRKTILG